MKNCDLVVVSSLVIMLLLLFSVTGFHVVREMGAERESARAWKRSTSGWGIGDGSLCNFEFF